MPLVLDLDHKIDPAKQKMAYYNADLMPPPDQTEPFAVDRKQAMAAGAKLETPADARMRKARGGAPPTHYLPTRPIKS